MKHASIIELSENIAMVSVAHHSVHFANETVRAFYTYQPTCVAVEFPRELQDSMLGVIPQLPELRMVVFKTETVGRPIMVTTDPCDARIEAIRQALTHGLDLEFVDVAQAGTEDHWQPLPDHLAVEKIGAAAFANAYLESAPDLAPTTRQKAIAARLAAQAHAGKRVLFVGDVRHLPALKYLLCKDRKLSEPVAIPREDCKIQTTKVRPVLLPFVLGEIPYMTYEYDVFRSTASSDKTFSVPACLRRLLKDAAKQYKAEFDEDINLTEWRALFQFGRNLSIVRGKLRPGLYELVTASKACVDDEFGAIVLEIATSYLPSDIEDPEDLGMDRTKYQSLSIYTDMGDGLERIEPAYARPEMGTLEFNFKRRRPTPLERAVWQEDFFESFGSGICSWPPEDERIEKFFDFLRKRALDSISNEHTLVEEFSSSMQDGLDFRETMRNWHTGKLYVRRERRPPGKVGPVVLIWRDFNLGKYDLWRSTLYAENQNESDIAVYCAPLGQEMVGPKISRTEYHGIMSVFPAMGIPDVWIMRDLYRWRTCARLLLASAIMLSQEKYVAWVADKPPDRDLVALARDMHIGIIYLPLAGFSRKTLKRLRQVHILGSRAARGWAGDYITD